MRLGSGASLNVLGHELPGGWKDVGELLIVGIGLPANDLDHLAVAICRLFWLAPGLVDQAEALKPAIVRGILATLGDTPLERRDAALVALLFAGALRRSELAGLDYAAAGNGDGHLRLTAEAVEIVRLRSKARTEPVTVLVPREHNPGLVAALERWFAIAGIRPGEPLFRSIKKGGHIRGRLADGGVSLALKARVARYLQACGYTREAADAEAGKYSGHGGRVGMYTAASEVGIAIEAVAALARHKSLNVAQKYARKADQLNGYLARFETYRERFEQIASSKHHVGRRS
jgi:integrase